MVSVSECFSESYAEARPKFCSAAAAAGGEIRSWLNPKGRGPNGETLYLDTARFGPPDAANMLVLIAGTHGVEGHCGSGGEIAWLRHGGADRLPKNTGALLIHALNPHGFAWTRRVTEDNVDLNRNFVDHDKAYPKNVGYLAIADAVLPKEWNETTQAETERVFAAYAQKHGNRKPPPRVLRQPTGCRAPSAAASTAIPTASSTAAARRPGAIARCGRSPASFSRTRATWRSSTSTPASARSAMAS